MKLHFKDQDVLERWSGRCYTGVLLQHNVCVAASLQVFVVSIHPCEVVDPPKESEREKERERERERR